MNANDLAEKFKLKLMKSGIPHDEIRVTPSRVMIKVLSRDTADRWSILLGSVGMKRINVVPWFDHAKKNAGTVLRPSVVERFLIGAEF